MFCFLSPEGEREWRTSRRVRTIANDGTAGHGAKVGNNLGNGDGVCRETILVLQHCGVKVLGAVGLAPMSDCAQLSKICAGERTMKLNPAISSTR